LYFLSGSFKPPSAGFKECPMMISASSESDELPVAHTCFWELELPKYDTKEKMKEKVLFAIFEGQEGFYIA